jgi:hypothetical protein|tara:strand:- start:246 stop:422 length:177 start_codon:yes stop_codon:yes gene_type:complete
MKKYKEMYMFEDGIEPVGIVEYIDITDIEEILSDNPTTQSDPTQMDSSQLVKFTAKTE